MAGVTTAKHKRAHVEVDTEQVASPLVLVQYLLGAQDDHCLQVIIACRGPADEVVR